MNRAVAVDSRAFVEALDRIHGARRLVEELRPAARAGSQERRPQG